MHALIRAISILLLAAAVPLLAEVPPLPYGGVMPPFVVEGFAYKDPTTPFDRFNLLLRFGALNYGWPDFPGAFVLTPERVPQSPAAVATPVAVRENAAIRDWTGRSLVDAITQVPGALRFPADGSSAMVLDGIRANGIFDGRIDWRELPREGLSRLETVPEGGAVAWGEGALGGIAQLLSEPDHGHLEIEPKPRLGGPPINPDLYHWVVRGDGEIAATIGSLDTRSIEWIATQPAKYGVVQLSGGDFFTAGFDPVAQPDRGAVDRAASDRHRWLGVRWSQLLGKKIELTVAARVFAGSRGDGTPDQQESGRSDTASALLAGHNDSGFAWNGFVSFRSENSAGVTSFVDADRSSETPVAAIIGVPATAEKASFLAIWRDHSRGSTTVGVEGQNLRGEIREDGGFSGSGFTREWLAGGGQDSAGLWVSRDQRLGAEWRLQIGARTDEWREGEGNRRETDLLQGALLSSESSGARDGTVLTPEAGLVWDASDLWQFHGHVQRSYRQPTLEQLYSTESADNSLIDSNPLLRAEYSTDWQAGVGYVSAERLPQVPAKWGSPASPAILSAALAGFVRQGHDTIEALASDRPSGLFPLLGMPAAGEMLRKWLNVSDTRTVGVESSATWHPAAVLTVEAGLVLQTSRQTPTLPSRIGSMSITWQVARQWSIRSRSRWIGARYADDVGRFSLGESLVSDLGVAYALDQRTQLSLSCNNWGSAVEALNRTAPNLTFTGAPRTVLAGVRFGWK